MRGGAGRGDHSYAVDVRPLHPGPVRHQLRVARPRAAVHGDPRAVDSSAFSVHCSHGGVPGAARLRHSPEGALRQLQANRCACFAAPRAENNEIIETLLEVLMVRGVGLIDSKTCCVMSSSVMLCILPRPLIYKKTKRAESSLICAQGYPSPKSITMMSAGSELAF